WPNTRLTTRLTTLTPACMLRFKILIGCLRGNSDDSPFALRPWHVSVSILLALTGVSRSGVCWEYRERRLGRRASSLLSITTFRVYAQRVDRTLAAWATSSHGSPWR